ncbi:hypothetical protein [Rhizobium sp. BK602]|uniref:hypothetical protein n=1 Tax=Rhizobium sp. BK602 TaxID=2586986 RepID=UPI0016126AAA|nr:hypothetical protein [Rhizobium sp. BK602]MBB3610764.1 hypothetical protein [Rhizobium sp. BK602]
MCQWQSDDPRDEIEVPLSIIAGLKGDLPFCSALRPADACMKRAGKADILVKISAADRMFPPMMDSMRQNPLEQR